MQSNPSKMWLTSLPWLLLPAAALGQGRTWMVELGTDPAAAPATGPTTLQLDPGECKTVAVWVEDPAGQSGLLRNYDIIMPWFASGGSIGAGLPDRVVPRPGRRQLDRLLHATDAGDPSGGRRRATGVERPQPRRGRIV